MNLITICARGGSKGIPNKNIRQLGGFPLLYYTIALAKELTKYLKARISISSDSNAILNIAEKYGLKTDYLRPEELATDQTGKLAAINDLLLYEESLLQSRFEYIIDLDVTSPLRNKENVLEAFEALKSNDQAINIFSVSKAKKNPYFNMVEKTSDEFYAICKPQDHKVLSRQSAPDVFELNAAFYIYKRGFFDQDYHGPITKKSLAYVMPEICFDVDDEEDWQYLEYLLKNSKAKLL